MFLMVEKAPFGVCTIVTLGPYSVNVGILSLSDPTNVLIRASQVPLYTFIVLLVSEMNDSRKKFFVPTIQLYFGSELQDFFVSHISDGIELNLFIDDSNTSLFIVTLETSEGVSLLHAYNKLDASLRCEKMIIFIKRQPVRLSDDTMDSQVIITTILQSPIDSLYQKIKKLYLPILLESSQVTPLDPKLLSLLVEVEAGLAYSLVKQETSLLSSLTNESLSDTEESRELLSRVFSPHDELRYWENISRESRSFDMRERAHTFEEALAPIVKEFNSFPHQMFSQVSDSLSGMFYSFDEIWKISEFQLPYPEARMCKLIEVCTSSLLCTMQQKLSSLGLWFSDISIIKPSLLLAIQICENWLENCELFTGHIWRKSLSHPWQGPVLTSEIMEHFLSRLEELLKFRSLHEQAQEMLTRDEASESELLSAFQSFSGLSPLQPNPYTEPLWLSAVAHFHARMRSSEIILGDKLAAKFRRLQVMPLQLLREFHRYNELLQRPVIKTHLSNERETLLGQLISYVNSLRQDFERKKTLSPEHEPSVDRSVTGKNLPLIVNSIVCLAQILSKVNFLIKTSEVHLNDLTSYKEFNENLSALKENVSGVQKEHFDSWCREISAVIDDPESPFNSNSNQSILQLDSKNGELIVFYHDRLIQLLREVRNISAFGFLVPINILRVTSTADKYLQFGILLKQIAQFYNTIHLQIIPSQQPLLIASSRAIESLLRNPNLGGGSDWSDGKIKVNWDAPKELQAYIAKLQKATEAFSSENRRLRNSHSVLNTFIEELYEIDLLKFHSKWRKYLSDIRELLVRVEVENNYDPSHIRAWYIHWDHQLYKSLEYWYTHGIHSLQDSLPEIKIDIVYRNCELHFRPPFEEVRAKYFRELRKFLNIPRNFRGVGKTENISGKLFSQIIERNSKHFSNIYIETEKLLQRLRMVLSHYQPWIVFAAVNFQELLDNYCQTVASFEKCFKLIKVKGYEAGRMPNTVRVDCITVSAIPAKAAIEKLFQSAFDTLLSALQNSLRERLQTVKTFISDTEMKLSVQPQSIEEITSAYSVQRDLIEKRSELQPLLSELQNRSKLLRLVGGSERTEATYEMVQQQLSDVNARWCKLEGLIESQEIMISEQFQVMKDRTSEKLSQVSIKVNNFCSKWEQVRPDEDNLGLIGSVSEKGPEALNCLNERKQELKELLECIEDIECECKHFSLPVPAFTLLTEAQEDITRVEGMWLMWQEFNHGLEKILSEEWITFRYKTYEFEEFLFSWDDKLRKFGDNNNNYIVKKLLQEMGSYNDILPSLKFLKGEGFTSDHWLELFSILGLKKGLPLEKIQFSLFIRETPRITANLNSIKELSVRAVGEVTIREALKELEMWSFSATLSFSTYVATNREEVGIVKEWRETVNQVSDNLCLLQSLKDSSYFSIFKEKSMLWEEKLLNIDLYLQRLNQIQRKWMYLEPVFGSESFPREKERFRQVDSVFKNILREANHDPLLFSLLKRQGFLNTLDGCLEQLNRCQRALVEYLEEKRNSFSRFYFIGDEDLLEILGQATNVNVIQSHLPKLFAGINTVSFTESEEFIRSINSLDGEIVPLSKQLQVTAVLEEWLSRLTEEMKTTLDSILNRCLVGAKHSLQVNSSHDSIPSQVLCLTELIQFTSRCEQAVPSGRLSEILIELEVQLKHYAENKISAGHSTALKVMELKRKALILDTIHCIEIVKSLQSGTVCKSLDDWKWQKQIRYYSGQKSRGLTVRMVDASFCYTFEYQGNAPKLVHTNLTDKCYLTLTQGMCIGMGGNPYGPAGTGKTESVKALGGLLGRQVLVFNCDEAIDVKSMSRIFVGIVKCGAWGCFDEFNRLKELVLSALSLQIRIIQTAIKDKQKVIRLLENDVELDMNSGIFITLNPAGKGYGGRQKLPDNLKSLFLPIAMSRPDNERIAEVLLYSEGFLNSKLLATKIVGLFTMARELLSYQQHYDWGLRALKTVLGGAGSLLEKARTEASGEKQTDVTSLEFKLVLQAIRLNTLSKLTYSDCRRFDALIKDIFPGIPFEESLHAELHACMERHLEENGFYPVERQMRKCFELYEQLHRRMGVLIIGPSGSGKSFLWKSLRGALSLMSQSIVLYCVNPKAMPRMCLLGSMDPDTREWSDGIITMYSRKVTQEPLSVNSWIVCDGDIDPEWIESLNSVLDDNKLLTMPSGERIQFGPNVNFIFESHDLSCASPATISRMGMIFLSKEEIDIKAVVNSWLNVHIARLPKLQQSFIQDCVDKHFYRCLEMVQSLEALVIDSSIIGIVYNGLSHLVYVNCKEEFALAMIRGFGCILNIKARQQLSKDILQLLSITAPNPNDPCDVYYDSASLSLKSYDIDLKGSDDLKEHFSSQSLFPLIRTSEVQKNVDLFQVWLNSAERPHFILAGPDGCGKEQILFNCFKSLVSTQILKIYCNSQTTPSDIKSKLFEVCFSFNTNQGKVLRPKDCDRIILFIKGLNFPKPDKWGTVQLISFLQQIVTYNGFYDTTLEWVSLENTQIVATLSPALTLGRFSVTTRLTSVLRICYIPSPEPKHLLTVYGTLLAPIFRGPSMQDSVASGAHRSSAWLTTSQIHALARSMVHLYEKACLMFNLEQSSSIIFTPRQLTEWCYQFIRYLNFQDAAPAIEDILLVWVYEANRVFCDRLIGGKAREGFHGILNEILFKDWKTDLVSLLRSSEHLYYISFSNAKPVRIGEETFRPLTRIDESSLRELVQKTVTNYTREVELLEVHIFPEVLLHFVQINRVISKSSGSLLLCGRGGVGRHLSLKLVAYYHQMELVSPRIGRGFGIKQFKQILKSVLLKCGIEDKELIFSIDDYQILNPVFLEMINSILSSGEIPGLFKREELDPLLSSIRDEAADAGYTGRLESFFYKRVKRNLHIALILDISSPRFNLFCDSNPALYSCCSVVVMESWSNETLSLLPRLYFKSLSSELRDSVSQDLLAEWCVNIFLSGAPISPTPRAYLGFLKLFSKLFQEQFILTRDQKVRLDGGLLKINEATQKVAQLKVHAANQKSLLSEKQNEADSALELITKSMQQASEQKFEMETLTRKQFEERNQLEDRKRAIAIELSEIMPIVEQSKSAVSAIKPESLAEMKALRAPPDVIRDILEGVLRLMGIYDTSWNSMKAFLSKRGVKEEICQFDVRNLSKDARRAVEEFVESRSKSFEPAIAKRASVAAAPLASWVVSILKYCRVIESITPLEKEQNTLTRNLDNSDVRLRQLDKALSEISKNISNMKSRFEKLTEEAAKLKLDVEATQETIQSAENLVNKLDGEQVRWTNQKTILEAKKDILLPQCLLASSYVTFLGTCEEVQRDSKTLEWRGAVHFQDEFLIKNFLANEKHFLKWKHEGLPSDELSIGNAIILENSQFCPFIIDPSLRASNWLREHFSDQRLEVVNIKDSNFVTVFELSVRFGKTLIIQDVDEIEPILYPLVRREIFNKGSRYFVYIGDKQVDFNEDFKMYLFTRNPTAKVTVEILPFLSMINFSFTDAGLTSQLLAITIQSEKPELEVQKSNLLFKEEKLKLELYSLEDNLLQALASSEGSLLDNTTLLTSLNEAKDKCGNISIALVESKQLQDNIDIERNFFLPFAQKGSRMYFLLKNMSQINHMYRYSLESFVLLFKRALESKQQGHDSEAKVFIYTSNLQSIVYNFVSCSLFKSDLLIFALHFVHGLYENLFSPGEWEFFCGVNSADTTDATNQLSPSRSTDNIPTWCDSSCISTINNFKLRFPSLFSQLQLENEEIWIPFARSASCEREVPPSIIKRLTSFQRLLLIQALRPDQLNSAIESFCRESLGFKELFSESLKLKKLILESSCNIPILIMVSPGADPSQELHDIASKAIGIEKYFEIPIGQDETESILTTLRECSNNGSWLCLKNLHLAIEWLPNIEKSLQGLKSHENFRLILTSEQHPLFCTNLLNSCFTISYEIPPGVKHNFLRSYEHWTPEYIAQGNSPIRSQLLFTLTWFHVVLQERCNFIPQGWSKFYEFSQSDLRAAANLVDRLFQWKGPDKNGNILWWDFIHGIFHGAIYGGKIDNEMDIRIFSSFIKAFYNDTIFSVTHSVGPFKSIPLSVKSNDYIDVISNLSTHNVPSMLGLQSNVERTKQLLKGSRVLSQLKMLMIAELNIDHFDAGRWNSELGPLFILWKKLNQGTNLITRKLIHTESMSDVSPLQDFINSELNRALSLVQTIHNNLTSIRKVLNGTTHLSERVNTVSNSLLRNTVPSSWADEWEDGPIEPALFLKTVVNKTLGIESWIEKIERGTFFSSLLNLSNLFSVGSFLNAFRQHTSRANSLAIDDLKFCCSWQNTRVSNGSIYVEGFCIDGCIFDGNRITQTKFDSPSYFSLPPCYISWEFGDRADSLSDKHSVSLPLYSSHKRAQLVTQIKLPCNDKKDVWIQAGAAIYIA